MKQIIDRSEALLLGFSILFQIISLFTLLRVATGVAGTNPSGSPSQVVVVPRSLNQSISIPNSTPQFVNPVGNGLDPSLVLAAVFVIANIVVVSMLAFLYRRKRMKWFSIIISVFLIFNVTLLYFSFIAGLYSVLPVIAGVAASIITILAAARGYTKVVNLLALFLALELGSSFPILLQAPLNWIVPTVYSVFDIYAIYYGRLGKLVKQVGDAESQVKKAGTKPQDLKPIKKSRLGKWPDFGLLTINFGKIEIGMADIAFYTMVPAIALILVSLLAFFVVMVVLDIGLVLSFYVFRNREVAPGLPVPILLGLGALLLMYVIQSH
ncbi:MAG TPA: hypothetical protein VN739_09625 [Nitrososphaerales archaeon]|nr:hypothetical protein [Nitrososphaerales archaeon]